MLVDQSKNARLKCLKVFFEELCKISLRRLLVDVMFYKNAFDCFTKLEVLEV